MADSMPTRPQTYSLGLPGHRGPFVPVVRVRGSEPARALVRHFLCVVRMESGRLTKNGRPTSTRWTDAALLMLERGEHRIGIAPVSGSEEFIDVDPSLIAEALGRPIGAAAERTP